MNIYGKEGKLLTLGRQGENEVTSIRFPIKRWVEEYGEGEFTLANQRSEDPAAYPCVVTRDGDDIVWTLTASDLQYIGYGKAQLSLNVSGKIAKSEIFDTYTLDSLNPSSTPPPAWQSWIEQVNDWRKRSEAWAIGKVDGVDVPSTDPCYHNNAKWYAEHVGGAVVFDDIQGRPKYNSVAMTHETNIPEVKTSTWDAKLSDAPSDGKKYGRKDGDWVEVVEGGSGTADFDSLVNRPKYNGSVMTHSTNIPEVKSSVWDAKQNALTNTDAEIQSAVSSKHTHANKALLDTYSQTDANISDAVTKRHTHANKSELDLVQSGDVAKWNAKPSTSDIPTKVSDLTNDVGFTTNEGTVTSVSVQMNGSSKGTVTTSGTINLGTVLTEHQSLSAYRTSSAQDVIDATKLTDAPSDNKNYGRKNGAWTEITSGTTDFDTLSNRPSYNGSAMTHATSIPEVKSATWDAKLSDAPSDDKKYGRKNGEWVEVSSGQSSTDFDELLNRPKYNGTNMSHSTDIPLVKTSVWDGKQDAITDLADIRSGALLGSTALQSVPTTYRTASAQDVIDATKYVKPSGGIPSTDLSTAVQTSLGKADTALQEHQSLSAYRTSADQDVIDSGKVDKVSGKGLSSNDYTSAEKTKLAGIQDGAEVNVQSDWNAVSGDALILNKPSIPSKTSDLTNDSGFTTNEGTVTSVAVSMNGTTKGTITTSGTIDLGTVLTSHQSLSAYRTSADQDTIDSGKVDKVTGKGLSTNDYTTAEKTKLDGIEDGAEVNVQSDWNATSGDALILNKPTILPDAPSDTKYYARKDGAWEECPSGGSATWGSIGGTLSDQTDLATALNGKQATITSVQVTISTADWSSKTATKSVAGVTASNIIVVSPAPASFLTYGSSQIRAESQGSGTVTFKCEEEPTESVSVNVMIVG